MPPTRVPMRHLALLGCQLQHHRLLKNTRFAFRNRLRMMVTLARQQDHCATVSLAEIAKITGISRRYLEQLALDLRRSSLIRGIAGRTGGYQLARPANAISGANSMRFVPAVAPNDPSGLWWEIPVGSDMLAVSGTDGDDTTIDGTAFEIGDGVTVRDTNPGYLGANAAGGADDQAGYTRPSSHR